MDSGALMEEIRAKRFAAQNLVELSISYILRNSELFLEGRMRHLLQNLPNVIVQRFFHLRTRPLTRPKTTLKVENLKQLIFLLLNNQIEEDLRIGAHLPFKKDLFIHTLEHCPNFRKAYISLDTFGGSFEDLSLKMSTHWKKLKELSLTGRKVLQDNTFLLIRQHLPKLQDLEITETEKEVSLDDFTMDSVNNLAQMNQLQILAFSLGEKFEFNDPIWALIAGQMPSLKKLRIHQSFCHGNSASFLAHYERFYPAKPLLLEFFSLGDDRVAKWPQNISVEVLALKGPQSLEVLRAVPKGVRMLIIRSGCTPQEATQYVEIFGHSITSLQVSICDEDTDQSLDVLPLLVACPQVEEVHIYSDAGPVECNSNSCIALLPPGWFKKIKNFNVADVYENEHYNENFIVEILMQSEQICIDPDLSVSSIGIMRTILHFLRFTNNSCKYYSKLMYLSLDLFIFGIDELSLILFEECIEFTCRMMANSEQLSSINLSIAGVSWEEVHQEFSGQIDMLKRFARDLGFLSDPPVEEGDLDFWMCFSNY